MKAPTNDLATFIRSNALQLTFQVIGVGILLLNLWLASKLSPLAEDLRAVTVRVTAVETGQGQTSDLVERFIVVEERTKRTEDDVKEIKGDVKEILNRR